jgi:S-(hydroxymethyl)glutathione dehydrogenase/alcohol dehydrogenase
VKTRAPERVGQAVQSIRKAGTVVIVSGGPGGIQSVPLDLSELVVYQKRIAGALFGGANRWRLSDLVLVRL